MTELSQPDEGGYHTKSPFTEQGIRVLQRRSLPPGFLKVVGKQTLCHSLLSVPTCHPPKTNKYVLLLQCEVIQTAVDRILLIGFGVLIACNRLKMCSL